MPVLPFIELQGISKRYREGERVHSVLADLNVGIERGQLVVLLGRSGSGKSTLLNLIGGLDKPDAGRIRIDNNDLTGLSEEARTRFRRRHIGFVFQAFNLIPTLTVEENLRLPLELNKCRSDDCGARIESLLAELEISDRRHAFPDRLSGGEQQRVAIARALVHDPMLVLADEPTGNLDLETGRQVIALLDRLTRNSGRTLLMATHSREVVGLADRVLRLQGGRLVDAVPGERDEQP